jgi:glycine cleavage system H protein
MAKVIDADNIRYTKSHEWVMLDDDLATLGITEGAQDDIRDIAVVELPSPNVELNAGDEAATLESQSDSLSIAAPLDGRVVEVNRLLEDNPGLVNSDPYGDGWLFRFEPANVVAWNDLMTAEEYEKYLGK